MNKITDLENFCKANDKEELLEEWDYDKNERKPQCLATNEYVDECITGLLKEEFVKYNK